MMSRNPLPLNDPAALHTALLAMTNAARRTAMARLAEWEMPRMQDVDAFWHLYGGLVQIDSKMWLGTCLKALVRKIKSEKIEISWEKILFPSATIIDLRKTVSALLPELKTPADVARLIAPLPASMQEAALFKAATEPAYYVLFRDVLKPCEDQPAEIRRIVLQIVRRANEPTLGVSSTLHYNMASLACAYFGITDIQGTFSLQLAPYQLSRLDEGFEAFCKILHT